MNIDRHNYEEYFILYMDNELSSEDRRQVEAFVQIHPDLQEELELLLQSRLVPDQHVVFENKEELMMFNGAPASINESNYEEWLVLYTDNELDEEQKHLVESFTEHHPAAKNELALLLQTRLQPEEIVFPDKKSLYRREEKTRRIGWWKIAAAAVLLAAIATTTAILLNKNNEPKTTGPDIAAAPAKQTPAVKQQAPVTTPQTDNKNEQPTVQISGDNNALATYQAANDQSAKKLVKQDNKKQQRIINVPEQEQPVLAVNDNTNNQAQSLEDPVRAAELSNTAIINDLFTEQEALTKSKDRNVISAVTSLTSQTYKTKTPVDREIFDTPGDIVRNDGKKNKLRGFLRKVTRTFEKNTNIEATDDDDRLLVGGLAIKL